MSIKKNYHLFLFLIVIIATVLRLYDINWDQGYHLHPDERAITLYTLPLHIPKSIPEFFSPASTWNPHFFAYGNFPLYLLKTTASFFSLFNSLYSTYQLINIVGRYLSVVFDIGTLYILFLLTKKIFNTQTALLAIFLYAISVLPIQLSHFFAVDTPLTFFITTVLYFLILFYEKPTIIKALLIGFFFGLALGTKNSALVLLSSILITLATDFLLIFVKTPHHMDVWIHHLSPLLKKLFYDGGIILITTLVIFAIVEPYAFLDFPHFWQQTMQQYQMTHDAFTFPYTLQYVGKTPYIYEIKNIFLWGQGPILSITSFLGFCYFVFLTFKKVKKDKWAQELIILTFFVSYFLVTGSFAIGFMRYLLPIYPLLALFAALFIFRLNSYLKKILNKYLLISYCLLLILLLLIWPLSFMNIYRQPNTRVLASTWINQHITSGSKLSIEHWDDSLPLFEQEKYQILTLPLYNPDTEEKWQFVNQQLQQTDYIIIASNRLYTPLQKLTACRKFPPSFCYPKTAQYYKKLFDGELEFTKVAEFSIHPKLEIGNWKLEINDESADESFTVYDHPKIMIFKRTSKLSNNIKQTF